MKQHIGKKWLLLIPAAVLIYCLAWLLFYWVVCQPRKPANGVMESSVGQSSFHIYRCGTDANERTYHIYLPKFGYFICTANVTSTIYEDMSEIPFTYSGAARLRWNGTARNYAFNIQPTQSDTPYKTVLVYVDADGNLLNSADLSSKEQNTYEAAKREVLDIIANMNDFCKIRTS